jgi:proteasome accessory factor C
VLPERAEVPEDFDPTRYRGAFSGEGSLEVVLEIAPEVATWFEDYYPVTASKPLRGGWRRIELVSGGIPWAAALVVRLGKGARAVAPPAVADAARELAARIAALYEAPV